MTKNLVPLIVKEFGIEIGEEFYLKVVGVDRVNKSKIYKFNNNHLLCQTDNRRWFIDEVTFANLITGAIEIVKIPFEPKIGELYWTYVPTLNDKCAIRRGSWRNDIMDNIAKRANCVFRTEEEAIVARPARYKELTGKEWTE